MIYFVTFSNRSTTNIRKKDFEKEHKQIVIGRTHCFNVLKEIGILVYFGTPLVIPGIIKKRGIVYI